MFFIRGFFVFCGPDQPGLANPTPYVLKSIPPLSSFHFQPSFLTGKWRIIGSKKGVAVPVQLGFFHPRNKKPGQLSRVQFNA